MKRLTDKLKTGSAKGVLSILTGGVISKAAWAVFGLILSKFYGPENFGVYNVFLGYLGILSVIGTLRLEHILVISNNYTKIFNFYKFLLCLSVVGSLAVLITAFLLSLYGSDNHGGLTITTWVLTGLGSLFSAWVLIQNALFTKLKFFNAISVGLIVSTMTAIIFQTGFYFIFPAETGFYGLIGGYVIGLFASVVYYLRTTRTKSLRFESENAKEMIRSNIEILKYAFPSESINTLANNLFIILAAIYFDKIEVGVFALALKILATPMTLLFNAFSKVYFQKAAGMFHTEKEKLLGLTLKVSAYSGGLNLLFLIFANTIGLHILQFYYKPEEWPGLNLMMYSITFWIFVRSLVSPISQIAIVINRNQFSLWMNIGLLLSNFIGIYAGVQSGSFITSVLWFAMSAALMYLIFYIVVLIFLNRYRTV